MIDFRGMRYFVAVAEELHFGRAARKLHISQPPLSQQIRNLESRLGVELFRRTSRQVELTPAGDVLLQRARLLLAGAEEAGRAARRASRGETGRLAIGFIHAATYTLLPPVLAAFRARLPDVELVLRELTIDEQQLALAEGAIDAGFLRLPLNNAELRAEVVLSEPFVIVLPRSHPLARKPRLALKSLAAEPFVMFTPRRSPLYGQIMSACSDAGFSPGVVQEATHIHTVVGLVRAGIGLAMLPASVQAMHIEGACYVPLAGRKPRAEIALAWRRDHGSPILKAFHAVVRSVLPRVRASSHAKQI
jgi:DNA-binding transcriptional LysR family regulator